MILLVWADIKTQNRSDKSLKIWMNVNSNTCFHSHFGAFLWSNQHSTSNMMLQNRSSKSLLPLQHEHDKRTLEWIANSSSPFDISPTRYVYTTRMILIFNKRRQKKAKIEIFIECVILDFHSVSITRCDF